MKKKGNNWELLGVTFKPDISMEYSYGQLEILVNENTYTFEEVEFESDGDEVEIETIIELFEEGMEVEDYAEFSEEIIQEITNICTKDLKGWR